MIANLSVSGQYLVAGEWIQGSQGTNVHNPAKISEIVGEVALCSKEEVKQAIDAAASAYASWSKTSPEDRATRMHLAGRKLRSMIDQFVPLFVHENGKVMMEAKKDLLRCVDIMTLGANALMEWWTSSSLPGDQKVQIRKRSRGVTAVISPWNSPMLLTFKRMIPAILAGNTVVVKPATGCPLTVLNSLKVIEPYFPPGVINVITGSGSLAGEEICRDPRVRTIAFTGSTETGKKIINLAAEHVKKMYMELGGNDPALILQDANLDEIAMHRLRMGILQAAGQVCSAIKRVYVHESRYDELVTKLTGQFQRVVVGNGIRPNVTMGPLNNKAQFDFVSGLIDRTKRSGANVITAGQQSDPDSWEEGYFMLPTIVTGLDGSDELVRVEQFGPVIPILPFSDLEEAVEMANDSEYGLRASVWTADRTKAEQLADRLEAGAVFHNHHTIFQDLSLDFPGLKESGLSRESQWFGLDLFADSYGFAN